MLKPPAKLLILAIITGIASVIVMMLAPIPQNQVYHHFADRETLFGIPNFTNVISNLPFLLVGIIGLISLKRSTASKAINRMYAIIFIGIFLTGLGSAYYHYIPNNNSLVYDRIPITIVFMAFLSSVVAEWINAKAGNWILFPLLLIGIFSVLWWSYTEQRGAGDLRFYAFIQFYPVLIIPVIFLLFRSPGNNNGLYLLVWVIVWYVMAKLLETADTSIYFLTGFISGHSLKHIAAAAATWYIVKFFRFKHIKS